MVIGVARKGLGGNDPQLFRTYNHFVLWEAVSQTKWMLFAKNILATPKCLGWLRYWSWLIFYVMSQFAHAGLRQKWIFFLFFWNEACNWDNLKNLMLFCCRYRWMCRWIWQLWFRFWKLHQRIGELHLYLSSRLFRRWNCLLRYSMRSSARQILLYESEKACFALPAVFF